MLRIPKTPKCYVGGAFIRSESGRVYEAGLADGSFLANIPRCTRKDLRNAVEAAAKAGPAWYGRTAYNRAQILYRLAEMMASRAAELATAITASSGKSAVDEVRAAIDRVVYFAGWADKFEQVLGSVNPVAGTFFNFTTHEPVGVVGIIAPEQAPLLGLLTLILPAVIAGNSVVALASHHQPYPAIVLGEILAVSDLPGGVLNLLTGYRDEILPTFATHENIRALVAAVTEEQGTALQRGAANSVKRVTLIDPETDWFAGQHDSPYTIHRSVEQKTIWHPVGF